MIDWLGRGWRRLVGKSKVKPRVRTLSAQVTTEEYERYQALAEAQGIKLSSWVKNTLAAVVPAPAVPQLQEPAPQPQVRSVMGAGPMEIRDQALDLEDALNASFESMDHGLLLAGDGGSPFPIPGTGEPPRRPAPQAARVAHGRPRESLPVLQESPHGVHACRHLNPTLPPNMTWNDCQGMCRAQHGRPCHWPSQAARQCPSFGAPRFAANA